MKAAACSSSATFLAMASMACPAGEPVPGSCGYQRRIVDEGVPWMEAPSPHHTVAVPSAAGEVATLAVPWAGAAQFVVDQDPEHIFSVAPAVIEKGNECLTRIASCASIWS